MWILRPQTLKRAFSGAFFLRAPSMGALLRVQVPSQVDHDERSEAQLHEGDCVAGEQSHRLPPMPIRTHSLFFVVIVSKIFQIEI